VSRQVVAVSAPVKTRTPPSAMYCHPQWAAVSGSKYNSLRTVRPARHQLELLISLHDAVKMRHLARTARQLLRFCHIHDNFGRSYSPFGS
jgi:hypothetical protein